MKLGQPWLASGMAGLIVAGVAIDRAIYQVPAEDSLPYHAHVRTAATQMPEVIGEWKSQDVEVPTAAQKLLRSNVLLSRAYINQKTGDRVSFLLVQCGDARDLTGHYPPNCYPSAGYTLVKAQKPLDVSLEAQSKVRAGSVKTLYEGGMLYQFTQDTLSDHRSLWVFNLMLLPNGTTSPDMGGVYGIARDRRLRHFGAAEIQVITSLDSSEGERVQAVDMLLAAAMPLIDAIRSGVIQ